MTLALLVLLAPAPAIELAVEGIGTPEAALFVHVKNPPGHRPIAFLREFWKFWSVECTLQHDGAPVPTAFALRPDRPTLAQLVVLEPRAEYGEHLALSYVWGANAVGPGAYHVECRAGSRAPLEALYEASLHGGAKRATPGLQQDLRRIDFSLADLRPAALDFKIP